MTEEQYWKQFISKHPEYKDKSYTAWQFGADPDVLAELVISGKKLLHAAA